MEATSPFLPSGQSMMVHFIVSIVNYDFTLFWKGAILFIPTYNFPPWKHSHCCYFLQNTTCWAGGISPSLQVCHLFQEIICSLSWELGFREENISLDGVLGRTKHWKGLSISKSTFLHFPPPPSIFLTIIGWSRLVVTKET